MRKRGGRLLRVSLAFRLLVAFSAVAVLAVALVGWSVRETTRELVEADFQARIDAATRGARASVAWEVQLLRKQLPPLCTHGTFVDKALVELEKHKGDIDEIDAGPRIAFKHHVVDEAAARNLDHLVLATSHGYILGHTDPTRIGTSDPKLAELLASEPTKAPAVRQEGPDAVWLSTHCTQGEGKYVVGLVGSRRISPILQRVGEVNQLELSVLGEDDPNPTSTAESLVRPLDPPPVEGMRVYATVSREPLRRALARLDEGIVLAGAPAVLLAMLVALGLARTLSRPISALAREAREVVAGEPRPVRGGGGREIKQLAASFNKTLDELTAMRRRLAATERIAARREVARQVAHEIKNPLAPIRAAVETLRRLRAREDPAFDEYFDEATATVLDEVHRITNIVTEFTKFARLPAPAPAPMDLVATARSVVALHDRSSDATGDKKSRVELQAEAIPEVNADRDQIVQVLTNLVQNGLDAATEVREDARVVVSLSKQQDKVRIVVRDNGPGIADDMVDRIFEPYATTKDHGTGLGLAIVQRIVFEHGGEITYRPATKGGAVFEILLPIAGPSLLDRPLTNETTSQPLSKEGGGVARG